MESLCTLPLPAAATQPAKKPQLSDSFTGEFVFLEAVRKPQGSPHLKIHDPHLTIAMLVTATTKQFGHGTSCFKTISPRNKKPSPINRIDLLGSLKGLTIPCQHHH